MTHTVTIDGKPYELRRLVDLNDGELSRVRRASERLAALARDASADAGEQRVGLIRLIAEIVLDAPAELVGALRPADQWAIVVAYNEVT